MQLRSSHGSGGSDEGTDARSVAAKWPVAVTVLRHTAWVAIPLEPRTPSVTVQNKARQGRDDHYVPQALTRRWLPAETLNVVTRRWGRTSPRSTFVSVETYTVDLDGAPDRTLDSLFDRAWNRFCQVARDQLSAGGLLDAPAKAAVREWVASQWARTPTADYLSGELVQAGITPELVDRIIDETVEELGVLPEAAAAVRDPLVLANLNAHLPSTRRRDQTQQAYRMLDEIGTWALSVERPEKSLVLSDHPVVLAQVGSDGQRTHVLYAVRYFDELMVPLTPRTLLQLRRATEPCEAPTAEWYNAAATRQAYEHVVAQDRADIPPAAAVTAGVRSLARRASRRRAATGSRAIPRIPDPDARDFIGRTMKHEQRMLDGVIRDAVGRVLNQCPLPPQSRGERSGR